VPVEEGTKRFNTQPQDHGVSESLEFEIIENAHPALFRKERTVLDLEIRNTDRAIGAIISNEISKIYGAEGLPDNTLKLNFSGAAGQSFGAFATRGLTMVINGNANDYLGKGLCGARLVLKVPEGATFRPEANIIAGNVCLYGATSGEAYINGVAGERFCVRNSGARAVVEGIGDHGCEYMTGGVAVILGEVGRNFGAGMSGGIAYVLDSDNNFARKCQNPALNLLPVEHEKDVQQLRTLVENHYNLTMSPLAQRILESWDAYLPRFVKVFPEEYRKALVRLENEHLESL
jgi:glutamate synthase (ferredoxin)